MKLKGYLLAALAAATYGTNPAFAVPLYEHGMNPNTVLIFRYAIGVAVLAAMILLKGDSLRVSRRQLGPLAVLGGLMAISSLTLFESYNYMNSGIASTLLFVYPVMVAMLMTVFFHERFHFITGLCLVIMGGGLLLLLKTPSGMEISSMGVVLVMLSSLTYAVYMVMINVAGRIREIPTPKMLFWQLLFGCGVFLFMIMLGTPVTPVAMPTDWILLSALALLPTVVSLTCTTKAIHLIGSTPTAIFGALEPLTAVLLSVVVLHQSLTPREMLGGLLIIISTTLVIASDSIKDFCRRGLRRVAGNK